MNAGGAETFLMKLYRNIDLTQYQMDFCINVKEKCFYEDEILSMGGRIFRIPSKSGNLKDFKRQLTDIVKNNGYERVLRITSSSMGFMDLKIAKKAGAKVCCARSSNSSDGGSLKSKLVHILGHILYSKYVDIAIAPSDLAAIYTFGESVYRSGKVSIIHNAVDLNVFFFDEVQRVSIRQELGISDDTKVFGHVGRFSEQKNHMFLADIFKCIHDINPNTKFLLVGDGSLRNDLENKIKALSIDDCVIFLGIRSDIAKILSAMDVFVFPSFYEGMPNTVIEAQATGLPCIISDTITKEADITGLVEFFSLREPAHAWAAKSISMCRDFRIDSTSIFVDQKYDIQSVVKEFEGLLFE